MRYFIFIGTLFLIALIFQCGDSAEINPDIMRAIAMTESSCNPFVVGDDGRSIGLFQVQLSTARLFGFKGNKKQLLDPYTNYQYAVFYMEHLVKKYKGNIFKSLYVYNAGDLAAKKYHFFSDKKYPKKIFRLINQGKLCDLPKKKDLML